MNPSRWPLWAAISLDDLLRCGLLLPRPGERAPRRLLHVPRPDAVPPPRRPVCWSGEAGRDLTVPVFSARGRLQGYCKRGDAWTSAAGAAAFC